MKKVLLTSGPDLGMCDVSNKRHRHLQAMSYEMATITALLFSIVSTEYVFNNPTHVYKITAQNKIPSSI